MGATGKRRTVLAMLAACLHLALVLPSHADDWRDGRRDHDRARRALEAGEILPLDTVLERVARDTPGRVMEVELEREHGRWVYEIRLLRSGGVLIKLMVDARDGTVITNRDYGSRAGH